MVVLCLLFISLERGLSAVGLNRGACPTLHFQVYLCLKHQICVSGVCMKYFYFGACLKTNPCFFPGALILEKWKCSWVGTCLEFLALSFSLYFSVFLLSSNAHSFPRLSCNFLLPRAHGIPNLFPVRNSFGSCETCMVIPDGAPLVNDGEDQTW